MSERERNIVLICDEIAERAHHGIFRRDGKTPYIEHPRAVRALVDKRLPSFLMDKYLYLALASVHDVKEDNLPFYNLYFTEMLTTCANAVEVGIITAGLNAISKHPKGEEETYLEYLRRVKNNMFAREVKICDIQHNMSDLEPCNMKDKYELALYFLMN